MPITPKLSKMVQDVVDAKAKERQSEIAASQAKFKAANESLVKGFWTACGDELADELKSSGMEFTYSDTAVEARGGFDIGMGYFLEVRLTAGGPNYDSNKGMVLARGSHLADFEFMGNCRGEITQTLLAVIGKAQI